MKTNIQSQENEIGAVESRSSQLPCSACFFQEVGRLRKMWGDRKFWQNRERALKAFEGLTYVYFNTESSDSVDGIYQSTRDEFETRLSYS